jgi:hypothetical protein
LCSPNGVSRAPARSCVGYRPHLRSDADVLGLAHVLMAACQGGMLISEATGQPEPLRAALYGAIYYVAGFAACRS